MGIYCGRTRRPASMEQSASMPKDEVRENTEHGSCRAVETMPESLSYILSGMRR